MLLDDINGHVKDAMRAKDSEKLTTLRMLTAALKNAKIDLGKDLEEDDVIAVVKKTAKSLKDSLKSFEDAGRDDLATGVKAELEVISTYLPAEMADDILEGIVKEVIAESGATSMADMGKVMGAVMGKVAGGADGGRVKEMVGKVLGA